MAARNPLADMLGTAADYAEEHHGAAPLVALLRALAAGDATVEQGSPHGIRPFHDGAEWSAGVDKWYIERRGSALIGPGLAGILAAAQVEPGSRLRSVDPGARLAAVARLRDRSQSPSVLERRVRDTVVATWHIPAPAVPCGQCGAPGEMRENPYAAEIHGDHTLHALCDACAYQAAQDI